MNIPADPRHDDFERRLTRVEAWLDARLVTRDVFEVWSTNIIDRLDKTEDALKWIMRFAVAALLGAVLNIVVVAMTQLGR